MSTVYLALLKAIENNYRKSNQPSSRLQSQSRKENDSSSSFSISVDKILQEAERGYSGTGYLNAFIASYVKENPEMAKIVDKIEQNSRQYLNEDIEKSEQAIADLIPVAEKTVKRYTSSLDVLEEAGFDVEVGSDGQDYWYVASGTTNNYEYHTMPSNVKINGVPLTMDMFVGKKNPYKANLEDFTKRHPNCEQELEDAKKECERLSSNKLLLSLSKKRSKTLEELKDKVENLQKIVEQKQKLEKNVEFYDSLTKEQETKLAEYFTCKNAMLNLHNDVYQKRNEVLTKQGYGARKSDLEKYDSTFVDSALETLTPEESTTLQKFLDDVAIKLVTVDQNELETRTEEAGKYNLHRDMVAKYLYSSVAQKTNQILSELENESNEDKELTDY